MKTASISTRLDPETPNKLDLLAKATAKSKSFLVAEAVEAYLERQAWQIEAIQKGINEADRGDFAADKEVESAFKKYGVNADSVGPPCLKRSKSDRRIYFPRRPGAARELVRRTWEFAQIRTRHPYSGRADRMPGTRDFIIGGTQYSVPYCVVEEEGQNLRVERGGGPNVSGRRAESVPDKRACGGHEATREILSP